MAKRTARSNSPTLFDDEVASSPKSEIADTSATLKSSFSKRSVLMQCLRRFYYEYYGAHRHKAKDDPNKENLRRLKMMVTCQERAGQILHFTIAHYLREAQAGRAMTSEGLMRWAKRAFQKRPVPISTGI